MSILQRMFDWYNRNYRKMPLKGSLSSLETRMINSDPNSLEQLGVEDIHRKATENVKKDILEWIDRGAESETTTKRNRYMLDHILFYPRSLSGVETAETSVQFLGKEFSAPIFIAPMGRMGWIDRRGEIALAHAAEKLNVPLFVSDKSTYTIEDIRSKSNATIVWMRYYEGSDEGKFINDFIRAKEAGAMAVGITIDAQLSTKVKYRDLYNYAPKDLQNRAVNFNRLKKIIDHVDLPFIVKGCLNPVESVEAVEAGASAIIVSNHGGRSLDYSPSSIEMLPKIIKNTNKKAPVLFDSGIRHGSDILKAIALGANGVLLGRPVCWGLAAYGEDGVVRIIKVINDELKRSMVLTGCRNLSSVGKGIFYRLPDEISSS